MRKFLLLLFAVLALSVSAAAAFTDVPEDHWAASSICDAVDRHVTTGFPDGTFRPGDQVSRGQLLAMLLRAVDPGGIARAEDGDAWWQPYYDAALEKGILSDIFPAGADMDAPAARRELAALLLNADEVHNGLRLTEGWAKTDRFSDEESLTAAAAAASGLFVGYPDGTFRGDGSVTRAEACTAVMRLFSREDWLGENQTQVVYTGALLIRSTLRPDGGAVLESVRVPEGTVVQTLRVDMDNFAGFEDQQREDRQAWAERWGRTVSGADKTAFWGEIGYYTYTAAGKITRWTDRAVLDWMADGEAVAAVSHRPGRRVWFRGDGIAYRLAGDQVIRFGRDGQVETLLSDQPAHGLTLTAVTGVEDGRVLVRREEVYGMADHHVWEYAVENGRLLPQVHEPGAGWSGFTPAEAQEELARLEALGAGI